MIEAVFGAIAAAVLWMYFRFVQRVERRVHRLEPSPSQPAPEPGQLTVIVPCRNEAERLPFLLTDLQMQSYPVAILVIDDGSEDGTAEVAASQGVRVIAASGQGKKAALAEGFRAVHTPWMATVDADVRLRKDWAKTLLAEGISNGSACVLGGVVIAGQDTAWNRFQQLEFGVMQCWIAGGVRTGELAMGSGANSLYRTDAYPVDALHPEMASGDDAFALNALQQAGASVHWCHAEAARVRTVPAADWPALWQQRARWASKTGGQDRETRSTAVLIAAVHVVVAFLAAGFLAQGTTTWILLITGYAGLKIALDARLLRTVRKQFHFPDVAADTALFSGRYALLVWGAWWQLLRGRVEWKGRQI